MKKILVLLVCLFIYCCEQKPVGTQEKRQEKRSLKMENRINEDIELLAVKYSIDSNILIDVIGDYEELTRGYSLSLRRIRERKTITPKPQIVNIQTAINIVSYNYQIPIEKVGSILIDKKMLENFVRGGDD